MTSLPYVAFVDNPTVTSECKALAAVGRCRIDLTSSSHNDESSFRAIVEKNRQQAMVDVDTSNDSNDDEAQQQQQKKQDRKKYMKQGNALCSTFLQDELSLDVSALDIEVVLSATDLIETNGCLAACFLDAGCAWIVTDGTNLDALEAVQIIPRERLVAHFDFDGSSNNNDTAVSALTESVKAVVSMVNQVSIGLSREEDATLENAKRLYEPIFSSPASSSLGLKKVIFVWNPVTLPNSSTPEHIRSICCQIGKEAQRPHVALIDPTATQLGRAVAACIKTDRPDGLFTTVVCTRNNEALGLVYSSTASIVAALESGRGVYYSRSRNNLWRKGDTSGHYQILHRLDVDCDGDALRFTVTQRGTPCGAFCHLKDLTCWGPPRGLRHLEQTLQQRMTSAPEGSYTKRLFDDTQLLRDKLVEEAQELSEAVEKQHVAEELADLLYFAMTRAVKAGVSIDDAVAELDKRTRKVTRRKGDSKAFRIAAGQAILDKGKEESQSG